MSSATQLSLPDVAASFSAINERYRNFHAKLFSYIPAEPVEFANIISRMQLTLAAFPNEHPACMIIGRFKNCVPLRASVIMAVGPDGRLQLLSNVSDSNLPDCDYAAIVSPFEKIGNNSHYKKAYEAIGFVRSIISMPLGKMPFYAEVASFDFDSEGTISVPTGAIRMPLFADTFRIADVGIINEAAERLARQQEEYRQRLQRACDFYNLALNQKDDAFRFSAYWISLEILAGGKSGAIRSILTKAYQQPKNNFADDKLHFREIEILRHNLMHKGLFGTLQSYQERLLQLYFWDIVLYQIGLKTRKLALTLAENEIILAEKNNQAASRARDA